MTDEIRQELMSFVEKFRLNVPWEFENNRVFMNWVRIVAEASNEICNIAQYDSENARDLIWKPTQDLSSRGYSQNQLNIVNIQVRLFLPIIFEELKNNFLTEGE